MCERLPARQAGLYLPDTNSMRDNKEGKSLGSKTENERKTVSFMAHHGVTSDFQGRGENLRTRS
jgi:hypothetical protein